MAYNSNYLQRHLLRQIQQQVGQNTGRSGSSSRDVSGEASLDDIQGGVNPGSVFARQRFVQNMKQGNANEAAYQAKLDENNAATTMENLKSQHSIELEKLKNRQAIEKALMLHKAGIGPGTKPEDDSGYGSEDDIPKEQAGLPLQSLKGGKGGLQPTYGRSKQGQEGYDAEQIKEMKASFAAKQPGIIQKMRNFFYNPSAGPTGQGTTHGPGSTSATTDEPDDEEESDEDDYDQMSEDDLAAKARAGDKRAYQIGKQKFGRR